MIGTLAPSRGASVCTAASAWAALLVLGCATPPKMHLSPQPPKTNGDAVWWYIDHPANLRQPIVGIEQRVSSIVCRQTIFCDRGVRWFDYHRGQLKRSSQPLPGPGAEPDTEIVRAILRRFRAIPDDEIAAMASPRDLVQSLRRHRGAAQVASPEAMNYRRIDGEIEHFAHGAIELQAASKPF